MYCGVRRTMMRFVISAILLLVFPLNITAKTLEVKGISTVRTSPEDEGFDNNIIDFDEEYSVKYDKKYGAVPWHDNEFRKNAHKYIITKDSENRSENKSHSFNTKNNFKIREETTTENVKVIPIELVSTTQDPLISLVESTTEQDLTVIPLSTTAKIVSIEIEQNVTLPSTTDEVTTDAFDSTTNLDSTEQTTNYQSEEIFTSTWEPIQLKTINFTITTNAPSSLNDTESSGKTKEAYLKTNNTTEKAPETPNKNQIARDNESLKLNHTKSLSVTDLKPENKSTVNADKGKDEEVPIFTELDAEDLEEVPEDYYDSKDILPTSPPKTDAISVLFGLAGSMVESVVETVAERVVPKSIYDLFKRMQKQNEALEAERLRSREENGGIGQFGRGILKSLSTGLSKPLSQLMAGVKEAGSLDTDRGFVNNLASSVTSVANAANTYLDAFKDKVQAIYPGTVWCGDGHSAQARSSSDLGLFFFTDTCCRQHDACKIYIKAGETKYGLTNTGLFTRSHCSCDAKFRECLRRTNSLVSAQIGLTYFNVLGPQCFRRAHPIVKCVRRTRITGQKCEEYELDYTKPKMWQWFDNETF